MSKNDLVVKFSANVAGFKSAIKQAQNSLESFKKDTENLRKVGGAALGKIGDGFKKFMVGMTAATVGLAGIAGVATKNFAEFEQLSGGIQKIFDQIPYAKISDDADQAFLTMGMSANEYMDKIIKIGANFSATMGDQKGYNAAKKGMQALSDFASGTGKSLDEMNEKYAMITKSTSSYQSIADQFGGILPATSDAFLKQAQNAGILGKQYKKLTDVPIAEYQQAVTEMIHKGVGELGLLGNTAKEAQTTISGSLGMMKASWTNLLTAMADSDMPDEVLTEHIQNLVKSVGAVLKNAMPVFKTAVRGLAQVISEILPIIAAELPVMLPQLISSFVEIFVSLMVALSQNLPAIISGVIPALIDGGTQAIMALVQYLPVMIPQLLAGAIQLFTAIVQALPQILPALVNGIITTIVQIATMLSDPQFLTMVLTAAFLLFMAIVNAIPQMLNALIPQLPTIISNIVQFLTNPNTIGMLIKAAVELFMALVKAVPMITGALFGAFGGLIHGLWQNIQRGFTAFAANFGNVLGGAFKGAVNGVIGMLEGFINNPVRIINGAISGLRNLPGLGGLQTIPEFRIPRMYTGGIVGPQGGGSLIWAGDGGENEFIVPESKMASLVNQINHRIEDRRGATASGGATVSISVNVQTAGRDFSESDAVEIAHKINRALRSQGLNFDQMGALR